MRKLLQKHVIDRIRPKKVRTEELCGPSVHFYVLRHNNMLHRSFWQIYVVNGVLFDFAIVTVRKIKWGKVAFANIFFIVRPLTVTAQFVAMINVHCTVPV